MKEAVLIREFFKFVYASKMESKMNVRLPDLTPIVVNLILGILA